MTLGGRVEVTEDTFAEVELRSEPDLNFDLHSPVVRLGRSGEGCRRYLHHRYRMPNAATIATAILKRCITFIRRRQCWPKRYPMPAMNEMQRFNIDRKSTRLNSSHQIISYAVFCLKKKKIK